MQVYVYIHNSTHVCIYISCILTQCTYGTYPHKLYIKIYKFEYTVTIVNFLSEKNLKDQSLKHAEKENDFTLVLGCVRRWWVITNYVKSS